MARQRVDNRAVQRSIVGTRASLALTTCVFVFVPGTGPGRLREYAFPAPSVGTALSERRFRGKFDPRRSVSQEKTKSSGEIRKDSSLAVVVVAVRYYEVWVGEGFASTSRLK